MVRLLAPWATNTGKRVVRRPKLYLRDTGLLHALLSIESMDQLVSSPKLGASWEGFALESVSRVLNRQAHELYFWRTQAGAELDLFWQWGGKNWGVECKYQDAPRMSASIKSALNDLDLAGLWVIYPGRTAYQLANNVWVLPLSDLGLTWSYPE
jgi:hypothetical protein